MGLISSLLTLIVRIPLAGRLTKLVITKLEVYHLKTVSQLKKPFQM